VTRPKRELEHGTRHGYACPICCEWVQGIVRHEQRAHARQTA